MKVPLQVPRVALLTWTLHKDTLLRKSTIPRVNLYYCASFMASQTSQELKTLILVVAGLMVITISLVFGVIIGNLLPATAAAAPDSLSGWITTFATAAICVLTIVLAVETWRLRAAQAQQIRDFMLDSIRPNVSVELSGSHAGMNFMNVRVLNSGKGIARKIKFEFLNRNDQPASIETDPIVKVFQKLAIFRSGIQSLGVNQELKSFMFSFFDLSSEINADVFSPYVNIRITFEDTEGNEYENSFAIDFSQYQGFSEIGGNPLSKLADEAKNIREQLVKMVSGNSRLSVDIYTSEDRAAENAALRVRLAREREQRQQSNE